jgi:hypothetical protein
MTTTTTYCPFCAQHNHHLCTGHGIGATCECGAREHNPTPAVAAAMRRYEAPDRFTERDVVVLANEWRAGER